MNYLLDTSVFLWSLGAEHKLNKKSLELLSSKSAKLYLSAASSWEIAIKFALGALTLPNPPSQFIPRAMSSLAIGSLEITHSHALLAGELPPHHRDPFDRMLIAQAQAEKMVVLTADRTFQRYHVELVLCGK
ncbi:MAG TPA: type II toxin-antitoxin system VapC family toxin [Candidatus Acidoferrum sp.]|jgi:PIN domain nuclease of toxin-antitoxin system|nr:type II toxin-antitoxin system VapC family toxin [Candidatus Acidoferrum sp.]